MNDTQNLSVGRNIKIALFHLGSGIADVMTTGVWNRIMISDLGFAATPIGLLVSLRYFLAPLGIWAGRISDNRSILGLRRLFWVWLGRLLMVLSIFGVGMQTAQLARGAEATPMRWAILATALLLFSLGNALSGGTFLALIYDRTSEKQRGRAVGLVWAFLLLGFMVGGIMFGVMLPASEGTAELGFSPDSLQSLFIVTGIILGALWFFSLLGEERLGKFQPTTQENKQSLIREDLKLVWQNRQMRFFFWFLALSMMFAFSQDLILEPFAADVFDMPAEVTNRFAAYWGSMSIIGTLVFIGLSRRYERITNTWMAGVGVGTLVVSFALFAVAGWQGIEAIITPNLLLLGLGLGIWNVGTLGLMMDLSPTGQAGTFLGFWTLVVTIARGIGVSGGGIVRDIWLQITDNMAMSYWVAFAVGTIGLLIALWTLNQVQVHIFKSKTVNVNEQAPETTAIFVGAMD